jgi:trimeric autotransporter adhesin
MRVVVIACVSCGYVKACLEYDRSSHAISFGPLNKVYESDRKNINPAPKQAMFSRSHSYSGDSICRWCAETGNITTSQVFTIYLVDAGLSAIFLNGQDVWHGDVDMEMILKSVASLGIFLLSLSLISCNQDDGEQSDVQMLSALLPVSPSVSVVGPKRLRFSWDDVGADHYRLLKNPDGNSGYSPVGGDITTTSVDEVIAVHLTDWPNARYMVEACDSNDSCVDSAPLSISDLMIDAIGDLYPDYDPIRYDGFVPDCFSEFAMERCFGHAIAMSGDGAVMAVGLGADDVDARGVNGIPIEPYDFAMGPNSGAVFVFTQQGVGWSLESFIKSSNPDAGDLFGMSVSLSRDGTLLAVGAPYEDSSASGLNGDQGDNMLENTGAVYLFSHDEAGWREQAYLKIRNSAQGDDHFGQFVSLSGMGDRLAVGSQENIYLFHDDGAGWRLETQWKGNQYLTASDVITGIFALSGDGLTLAATADSGAQSGIVSHGSVYIYVFDGDKWVEQAHVMANSPDEADNFGRSLSLSDDGNTLAIGASREDSSALGVNGDETDNSAESSGAAYLFERQDGVWRQSVYLKASNAQQDDYFGARLVLSGDGRSLVVTALGEDSLARGINGSQTDDRSEAPPGAAYLFVRDGAEWFQKAYIKSPYTNSGFHYELPLCGPEGCVGNDYFGESLAISTDGTTLMVGVPGGAFHGPGLVYLY